MIETVLRTIRRYGLLPRGGRVLCALSAGGDSVALLHILLELQARGELAVVGVAHFNHGLRGADADGDEEFCRTLAASLGIPFEAARADIAERARVEKRSIEDTARTARYEFLRAAARRLGADGVAVGHTLDDQAETFLLRLIRGAGTRGLGGIRPKAGDVIRPLIEVRREALRRFAEQRRLAYREDATNDDVVIARNRVRHQLIPYLQHSFSPGIVEVLAREAISAQEDEDRLTAEAIDLLASVVLTSTADEVTVDAEALCALHPAIGSRVVRDVLARLGGPRFVGFEHVKALLDFAAAARANAAMSLPGQQARIHQGARRVVELRPEPRRGARPAPGYRFPLPVPGEVVLAHGVAVSADWGDVPASVGGCLIGRVKLPLAVRSRQPGDRFSPPGLGGRSKKLQDYLVDRKVPQSERDLLPIVVDDDNRIVWVVGHGVAEDFRVPAPSHGVISLKARRLGGEG